MRPDEHNDFRSRVIADCAALLPLARDACAAMETGDETRVLYLFCGESQRKTLRQLKRLIEDLRACRTSEDLPGNCPEVIELRNASFKVFRGLTLRVGNPLNLTKRFRSGAVDFFRMLTKRDAILLLLIHRGPWRRSAYDLLFAAMKANQYLLQLRQTPAALLRFFHGSTQTATAGRKRKHTVKVKVAAAAMGITSRELFRILKGEVEAPEGFPGLDDELRFCQWVSNHRKRRQLHQNIVEQNASVRKWGRGNRK